MHLLDSIWLESGCMYLSDLRSEAGLNRQLCVIQAVGRMDAQRYPLRQWQEAHQYMTGQLSGTDSPEGCKRELIALLRGENRGASP